ncbi:MAG: diguanylate cyclase [Coriobacteriia bacterium]|nr:diguanylate cyclase [Coriobacteriia bacterium]
MREVTPADDDARTSHRKPTLLSALLVAGGIAFVSVLILSTGRLSPAWILYLLPVILASLLADVPGGIVAAALSAMAVVLVASPSELSALWLELLTGLSAFVLCGIVVGIQARRQRTHAQALERVSTRDPVTGVRKAESFYARLNEEMRRSDRYGSDVGVVLARVEDIDEFSRTFGRYKTDLMLEHLADIMRLSARDTDIMGRVGPETFALAIPHADPAAAETVARRVAAASAAAEFEGDALEPATHCRVSVTSVSYPADAGDVPGLLSTASTRLAPEAERVQEARLPGPGEVIA